MVKLLLDRGAAIEAKVGYWSYTALHMAALGEVVKLLQDRGAAIEANDRDGRTALSMAGRAEVVELLAKTAADC